jgi:hypothetical protein
MRGMLAASGKPRAKTCALGTSSRPRSNGIKMHKLWRLEAKMVTMQCVPHTLSSSRTTHTPDPAERKWVRTTTARCSCDDCYCSG